MAPRASVLILNHLRRKKSHYWDREWLNGSLGWLPLCRFMHLLALLSLPRTQSTAAPAWCTASHMLSAFGSQENEAGKGLGFLTSPQRKQLRHILKARGIRVQDVFVMDISYKASHRTNHTEAAAGLGMIIQASNLIKMPLKLALNHNVTIFSNPV